MANKMLQKKKIGAQVPEHHGVGVGECLHVQAPRVTAKAMKKCDKVAKPMMPLIALPSLKNTSKHLKCPDEGGLGKFKTIASNSILMP